MIFLIALIILLCWLDLYHDGITPALQEVEREHGEWAAIGAALWVLTW